METFHINYLRPFQLLIIMNILKKEKQPNLLAILPTGSGKSLCFMLPSLLLEGITIIIYPLLSLMRDQEQRFKTLGIESTLLCGGMKKEEKNEIFAKLERRESKILITNVEMLCQESVLSRLEGMKVSLLVLDEAHTVISWGNSFRPVYKELKTINERLKPERILAFTATSDEETTAALKKDILGEKAQLVYGGLNRTNIIYHALTPLFPLADLINILSPHSSRPALIFTSSRKLTETLSKRLEAFFPTLFYHAGLTKEERQRTENIFLYSNDSVMVATCAYGMGVDKKNIRTVVHYNLPQTVSDYLQESGRAGRDGKTSHAYALTHNSFLPTNLDALFTRPGCIRANLITAMAQSLDEACSGCDWCDHTPQIPAGLATLQKKLRIPYFRSEKGLIRILTKDKEIRMLPREEIKRNVSSLIEKGVVSKRLSRLKLENVSPYAKIARS